MAKKKSNSAVNDLVYLLALLVGTILMLLYKVVLVIYYFIIYKKTNYKEKSDLGFFKIYFDKGNFGEFNLFMKLRKQNMVDNLFVNTYLLHGGNTDETEIDVLAVNKYGVFVYEMKNYSGYIYGNSEDKTWTQVLGRKKYKFFNPFRQNYAHTKALEAVIPNYVSYINPVVVFSNRSKLQKITLRETDVLTKLKLVNKIITKKTEVVLTETQINEIVTSIKKVALSKTEVKEKHISQVQALQEN